MNTPASVLLAALGTAIALTLLPLLNPLIGSFVGIIFQTVFAETAFNFMVWTKLNMQFWQLTAVVATLGGFFKSVTTNKIEG